jgi:SSS family solute:Na+ symporter
MAVTIPEVICRRFGSAAGTFTAVLNVLSLFLLTSSEILASGSIVSSLTGLPLNVSILLAGFAVIFYTTLGGMIADAITDVIQYAMIIFGLLAALPFVIEGAGGWNAIAAKLPPAELSVTKIGWVTIIGLIFNYFCAFLSGPETVSRFYSASDEKTARRASLISALMMALIAFIPTLMGLAALAMKPGLDAGKGTSALVFVTESFAPSFITGLVAAAILAAAMSSADSSLLCASTILIMDIYRKFFKPNIDDRKVIRYTRVCNVLICLAGMGIALFNIDLITLNLFAFALRSAGPFAAYGLGLTVRNATKNAGAASIITGSVAVITWQLLKGPFGIPAIVFGSFAGMLAFLIVSAAERGMGKPSAPPADRE